MATETAAAGRRANPILVGALVVVALAFAYMKFSGPVTPPGVQTPAGPRAPAAANGADVDPTDLDVRVEVLRQPAPAPTENGRNIFRAAPPPPPPAPPDSVRPKTTPVAPPVNPAPPPPPVDPGPPPIGNFIKFIGIAETAGGKIGAFSTWDPQTRECKATFPGREGEVIEGRFRIVRIGIESAVLEYLDGKGRTTLPLNGQACVSK